MTVQLNIPWINLLLQGNKSHIGIIFSTDDLKAQSNPLNHSSSSVIIGITPPFSLRNIEQNYSSVKNNTQFQSSKMFPDNSIYFEGTNLMSTCDNKLLKNVALKSTTTHQCSTSKTVKSNIYLTSQSTNNDTTPDNFINTTYKVDITSIENEW